MEPIKPPKATIGGRCKSLTYRSASLRCPAPFLSVLRSIANIWRNIYLDRGEADANEFAQKLSEQAFSLYTGKKDDQELQTREILATVIAKIEAGEKGYKANSATQLKRDILSLKELL
jgi:hypothetical protein